MAEHEAMSDKRLAELLNMPYLRGERWDPDMAIEAFGHVRELLAEAKRLRDRNSHLETARDAAVREWRREHDAADELQAALEAVTARAETAEAELRARLGETEWGRPRAEWTWAVRQPDGTALPPLEPHRPRAEDEVRREFAKVVENMGYRKVLLCRTVPAWREAEEGGGDEASYADKINAPLDAETLRALKAELASDGYARFRKRRVAEEGGEAT